jgi:ribosomal protein S18 acetylase RimI-like enzyme
MTMTVRLALESELDALASIWYEGWRETHAAILPEALARFRTLDSFRDRLRVALDRVRVTGEHNAPLGLCIVKGDELDQLYVAPAGRGTGVAAELLADAESRIAQSGAERAWLACAIGNDRAARFYEKHGWRRAGTMTHHAETAEGPFELEVWRYEKTVGERSGSRDTEGKRADYVT